MPEVQSPLEAILVEIEKLDKKMANHQKNCYKCSDIEPCDRWIEMIQDWNYYYAALTREIREEAVIPGYEK